MNRSRARKNDRRGKSAKDVFAANKRMSIVTAWSSKYRGPVPKSWRAIFETTVSLPPGTMPRSYARYVIPRNKVTEMAPSHAMTSRAAGGAGGLKAGTQPETDGTPGSAGPPAEQQRRHGENPGRC